MTVSFASEAIGVLIEWEGRPGGGRFWCIEGGRRPKLSVSVRIAWEAACFQRDITDGCDMLLMANEAVNDADKWVLSRQQGRQQRDLA